MKRLKYIFTNFALIYILHLWLNTRPQLVKVTTFIETRELLYVSNVCKK